MASDGSNAKGSSVDPASGDAHLIEAFGEAPAETESAGEVRVDAVSPSDQSSEDATTKRASSKPHSQRKSGGRSKSRGSSRMGAASEPVMAEAEQSGERADDLPLPASTELEAVGDFQGESLGEASLGSDRHQLQSSENVEEPNEDASAAEPVQDNIQRVVETTSNRPRSSSARGASSSVHAHPDETDEHEVAMPRRSRRAAHAEGEDLAAVTTGGINPPAKVENIQGDEDADGDIEGITRCVCGSSDENVGLMIQCEICKCWQHCVCMGMNNEEDCPDVYYCEQCKPELHVPLLRLLGVLPPVKGGTKKSSSRNGRSSSGREAAAKELRDAKAAVALLASQNAERRREGIEPLVANTANRQQKRSSSSEGDGNMPPLSPQNDAQSSRKSPKRRSTMNSRDSMYGGWEAIPPGLLNEDEVWDIGQKDGDDEEGPARKRKRSGRRDQEASPSPPASSNRGDASKRRRMSSQQLVPKSEANRRSASVEKDDTLPSAAPSSSSKKGPSTGKAGTKGGHEDQSSTAPPLPVGRPKQPNQYTYRKERAALAANAAAAAGSSNATARPNSPTPSPNKSGRRGGNALRESSVLGSSRAATPSLVNNAGSRGSAGVWGIPDHLSHLSHLLPGSHPEPLLLQMPTTKGVTSAGASKSHAGSSSNHHVSRPSPHAFTILDLSEPPTKVRFPGKRMTMGEMRKRVRNISEYVTRTQLEAVERGRRLKALGISIDNKEFTLTSSADGDESSAAQAPAQPESADKPFATETAASDIPQSSSTSESAIQDSNVTLGTDSSVGPVATDMDAIGLSGLPKSSVSAPTPAVSLSMRLLDNLSRDIIAFQQRFGPVVAGGPSATLSSTSAVTAKMGPTAPAHGSLEPEAATDAGVLS